MSWDVLIVNSTKQYPIEEVWENNDLIPSFGTRKEMQDKINALYPETNWSDPTYAHLDNGIYVGHISIGNDQPLDGSIVLHVYGGTDPLKLICSLCKTYGWTAYDTGAGSFIDTDNPSDEGWKEFQAFRQRIADSVGGQIGIHVPASIRKRRWWQFWK